MRHETIQVADATLIDIAARQCGELAIGCAGVSGQVRAVVDSVRGQLATVGDLQRVMTSLETDQRQVADATDEARLHSEQARLRLTEGRDLVLGSMGEFAQLTALIDRLGTKITDFASALDQVRRTTEVIDAIARTTNMLALNAAIEAERAGPAGASFAVVATEVKKLARDTRAATDEVGATMASLTREADAFLGEVRDGVQRGKVAERSLNAITQTISDVTNLVEQVDRQSEDIAHSAAVIHDHVVRVGDELDGFAAGARGNDGLLAQALDGMSKLEADANVMFDGIVRSGFAHDDGEMVAIARREQEVFLGKVEDALSEGSLSADVLFDTDYRLIPGSKPERFDTRLNAFADRVWRPELDRVIASDPRIVSSACTDVNGYLPTHTTRYSRMPTGDPVHDAAFCRHRRILADDADRVAKASNKDFHVSVFRREREGGGFDVVRNVYVPLIVQGRRWGDFEIAYRLG